MDVRHSMDIAQAAIRLVESPMDRPTPLSGDETAPVQTLRVLVPDPLLYSLGPHQNSDTYDQWL